MCTLLALAVTLVATVYADESIAYYNTFYHAGYTDETCTYNDSEYQLGETWYDDEWCLRLTCHNLNGVKVIKVIGCGFRDMPDGCFWNPDPGHFPECCAAPVCNSEEVTIEISYYPPRSEDNYSNDPGP